MMNMVQLQIANLTNLVANTANLTNLVANMALRTGRSQSAARSGRRCL